MHDPKLGLFRMDLRLTGLVGDLTLSTESSANKKKVFFSLINDIQFFIMADLERDGNPGGTPKKIG